MHDPGFIKKKSPLSAFRYIYSFEAANKLSQLIQNEKPDLAHLHIFYGELSLSVLSVLKKSKIPVVMTLHDFEMFCPSYSFIDRELKHCERCAGGNYMPCVTKRCNQGNFGFSLISAANAIMRDSFFSYDDHVDHFFAVSSFVREKVLEYRSHLENKLSLLPNFTTLTEETIYKNSRDFYFYCGRLSKEKGIWTLIKAIEQLPSLEFKIAGDGPEAGKLKSYCSANDISNITFLGQINADNLRETYAKAKCTIVPSECNESFGLVALESMASGVPVIASRIGALKELITNQIDGFLFETGNVLSLLKTLNYVDKISPSSYAEIAGKAKITASRFSEDAHYGSLISQYEKLIG